MYLLKRMEKHRRIMNYIKSKRLEEEIEEIELDTKIIQSQIRIEKNKITSS